MSNRTLLAVVVPAFKAATRQHCIEAGQQDGEKNTLIQDGTHPAGNGI